MQIYIFQARLSIGLKTACNDFKNNLSHYLIQLYYLKKYLFFIFHLYLTIHYNYAIFIRIQSVLNFYKYDRK